jgi:serine/threonine protein kinase
MTGKSFAVRNLSTALLVATALLPWVAKAAGAPPPDVGYHIGKRVVLRDAQGVHRYEIDQFIANGANGETYRAVDIATGEQVAVKLQRADPLAAGKPDRFARDHQLLSSANAPQLMGSYGVGVLMGPTQQRVHVMELVQGAPLKNIAYDRQWSTGTAVRVTMQILRGLRGLHQIGMRHNDLHLGNVMLVGRRPETVKVIDIGAASPKEQRLAGWGGDTMAPERPQGASVPSLGRVNADVYSAGAALAILLTGVNPRQNRAGALAALPNTTAQVNGVTVRLRDVIGRAMDPNPATRYQTAQELLNALRPFAKLA